MRRKVSASLSPMSLFPSDTDGEVKHLKGATLDEVRVRPSHCRGAFIRSSRPGSALYSRHQLVDGVLRPRGSSQKSSWSPAVTIVFMSNKHSSLGWKSSSYFDSSPVLARELINRTGMRTVPNIYIRGRHVGGYDELQRM